MRPCQVQNERRRQVYLYDRRFYLLSHRQFEYVLPSTGVLLRRFTLRPPGTFFSAKIEKLRGPAFAMTLSRDEQLNGFPDGSHGEGGKGRERSEIPSPKIREKLPLTSPILHGRKFPPEVEKRG